MNVNSEPSLTPNRHVLIVDDSLAVRLLLRRMMGELGFQSFEAANGAEALQCLARTPRVEFMIVDWNMPVLNGLEFVQAVRARAEYQNVPLIMVTTENTAERVAQALHAGANEYVMKPFTKQIMGAKLDLLGIAHQ